jgi:ribonuclease Y
MDPQLLWAAGAAVAGVAAGIGIRTYMTSQLLSKAEAKQKELLVEAKDEALKIKEKAKKDLEEQEKTIKELETSLRRREESLEKRAAMLDEERKTLQEKEGGLDAMRNELDKLRKEQELILEKKAKLKKEEARDQLLKMIEKDYRQDLVNKIKTEKDRLKEEAEKEGRRILSTVIERLASEHTTESTISSVAIPSEEMKGRIIGKEGRNIHVFEKETGVDLIVDDTPDTVVISAFDPVRRHVAKVSLERLIKDGRIQPSRIEEVVKKVQEEVGKEMKEAGEQAAYEAGVPGLHPDVLKILGRLKFRTSYGQNVLRHSVEVAKISGMLAGELGADVAISKKAGLLHDIGKAVSDEVQAPHHHVSMDIARKYGLSETVINAIGAHHDDIEPKTVEAILVKAADAISGARPGARRESLESYVKRLTELENIANSFEGVEKSYAIQAGREVRIIVKPTEIDDLGALKMAKEIAAKIERDMKYPGMIKVNVIRETRAVEFAK